MPARVEDDRAAPLAVADHLSGLGHRVTVVYRTTAPSPLVGKYTIGAILTRLDREGVELGDAYAPRRVVFATRQALQLAIALA